MNKPMMVAELGAAFGQSLERTLTLINAAAAAGADAVKFQLYTPDTIAADVVIQSGPWAGRRYHELYRSGSMPPEWLPELFSYARECGVIPFASPFSQRDVELLEAVNCPMYKIASPEIAHLGLIAAAAGTGKPIILSTGMASRTEIAAAVAHAEAWGAENVTVLHCISSYPANPADFNLNTMLALKGRYHRFGLSDHSLSPVASIIAASHGACMIEKHFAITREHGTPDAPFSLVSK